ncbi:ribose transport system ATP-binding protein [Catenibacillus scindens]|uniref:Ribose transport system ATP-binding protein n=1 Tax=Catenibacillus scindens TaxID=673271 RepID=A0A7W8H930_9FIRM|nr:sugar ABC transporter ATP-binding protein [Catenibacillus scindens]MBB5264141.1 ribose transport system ATP-binding protein [Catenibacillus scindens]
MAEEMLRIEGVSKSFGPTKANRDVNLILNKGTVLGLAGENGSGKSTLASMVCGMLKKDSGKFYKNGQVYNPFSPADAAKHGVAMVVQELGVIGNLSGVVNMFLGKMDKYKKGPLVDLAAMNRDAESVFEKWGLPKVPLDVAAGTLSIEQRKIMELARALITDPDFLVLDEISQALSQDNREVLYAFIKKFISLGRTILMVTHDLEEMVEICDEIAVLRDGVIVESKAAEKYSMNELKRLMIGREVSGDYYRDDWEESYQKEVILSVKNLNVPGKCENISFDLHKGEILAICGLSDAGIHEVGSAIFGLEEGRRGKVTAGSGHKEIQKPGDIIKTRGAYLSKDRDANGLMLDASIGDNLILPSARDLSGKGAFLSPVKARKLAQRASEAFEIKSTGLRHIVRRLSGGNKQKVNLSRWLIKDLDYIILDCPTRGVDIGVKAYIYSVLKKAKADGLGIIMISDELPEAMGMSDRILVMKNHQFAAMLSRNTDFTEDKIMEVML